MKTKREKFPIDNLCEPGACKNCMYHREGETLCFKYKQEPKDNFLMRIKKFFGIKNPEMSSDPWRSKTTDNAEPKATDGTVLIPIRSSTYFKMEFKDDESFGEVTYGGETIRGYIGMIEASNVNGKLIRKFTVIEMP